jgi:putative ABC transport system ATP-binding protein
MSDRAAIVQVAGLRKTYKVGKVDAPALRGVDLAVQRGEFVSIMGPSGCGKSTLLHIMGGLARPTSGQVMVDGVDLGRLSDSERTRLRREKIGFVFQRFNLFPTLTVQGNVEIAQQIYGNGRPRRDDIEALLDRVKMAHKLPYKPLELSVGEQQRVAIARALVNRPAILLADEPTGNLDSQNSQTVLQLLRELNRELSQTIVMITHNPEAATVGDRVVEMLDGRVVDAAVVPHLVSAASEIY